MAVPLTLKVYKGDSLVQQKDYERDIIKIGRLSSAHLCLDDEKVSRIHSVIEVGADGALSIIDMGSVEGTYVNGKRVNKGSLSFGDEIRVGTTTIRLESTAAVATVNVKAAASQGASEPVGEAAPAVAAPERVTTGLAQAAAAATALDPSFASTQRNEVVPTPAAVEALAPAAAPAPAATAVEETPASAHSDAAAAHAAPIVRVRRTAGKATGPLGASLRFTWGTQPVGEFFVPPGEKRAFSVGSAEGVDFVMGDSKTGEPRFEVLRSDGQTFTVRFTGKMKGSLLRKGETLDLKGVIETGKASHEGDAYALALEPDDVLSVDLGGVVLEALLQPQPRRVVVPLTESIDYTVVNIFLVCFFLASLFVIYAGLRGIEGDEYVDELSDNNARIAKLIVKPPEVQKTNKLLAKLNQMKEKKKGGGQMAEKHKGDEGQMGKKDAPKANLRAAPKGDPSKQDQARMLTQQVFGKGGGIATLFGKNGGGGELKAALGNVFGAKTGDAQGFGGMGLRGGGGGGGGTGNTVGIGGVGTKGRGGGMGTYGEGVGGLGGKQSADIGISAEDATVTGSLDKELIRQVVRRNQGQIRFCYENVLQRNPKLAGKVTIRWLITADGTVATSSVAQSTAGNAELETCLAGRVRTWLFPKPKGGGVVNVSYPFVFKMAGQ